MIQKISESKLILKTGLNMIPSIWEQKSNKDILQLNLIRKIIENSHSQHQTQNITKDKGIQAFNDYILNHFN